MQTKRKNNKVELSITILFCLLGFAVVASGALLLYYAYHQIVGIGDIDVNSLFRSPSGYLEEKKTIASESAHLIIPGIITVLIGEAVVAISCTRFITLMSEGRKILALEERIEKLESKKRA